MDILKVLSIVLVVFVAVLAAYVPFAKRYYDRLQSDFPMGEALAAGVFLGAGLLHMLPEADSGFKLAGSHYPWAFMLAGAMFLVLLLFEHVGQELHAHEKSKIGFAVLAMIMLSIHSFLAGAALGLTHIAAVTLVIMIAILAHKWAASFALAIRLVQSQLSLSVALLLFAIFALMTPLGIIVGNTVSHGLVRHQFIEPVCASLASGTFLYLGTLHGLKQAVMVDKCCNLWRFIWVLIGFVLMAVIAIWV